MKAIKIEEPKVCPFCGSPVIRQLEDGAHLYCSNPDCAERVIAKLNYFVTKECMNIEGLSEKTLRKIVPVLGIKTWEDLYKLTVDDLKRAGCGPVVSQNIIDELEDSKTKAKAENVLMALGIPNIGKVNAKKLLEEFKSIEGIVNNAKITTFHPEYVQSHRKGYEIIISIGEVAGQTLVDYINNNLEEFDAVCKLFNTKYESGISQVGNKLFGMNILATGTLKHFTREGIKESVIANGGTYASGISRKLTFLIVGENAGTAKIKKANELGVAKYTEEEYLNIINN